MPGTSSFGLRAIIAGAIFLVLLALFFTFPALMAGDLEAFKELFMVGGAMSFALLIGVLIVVLPLAILFGALRLDLSSAKLRMALAGGVAGFAAAMFGLGAASGDLSTAGVVLVTAGGAIAGWLLGARKAKAD
jgi:hypothetical protein